MPGSERELIGSGNEPVVERLVIVVSAPSIVVGSRNRAVRTAHEDVGVRDRDVRPKDWDGSGNANDAGGTIGVPGSFALVGASFGLVEGDHALVVDAKSFMGGRRPVDVGVSRLIVGRAALDVLERAVVVRCGPAIVPGFQPNATTREHFASGEAVNVGADE